MGAPFESIMRQKKFFAASTGLRDIDRRPDAFVDQTAIQHDLQVSRALEFLEHDLIARVARVDQRRTNNGQRSAFLDIPGSTKESFRFVQCVGVNTTGKDFSGRRDNGIVSTGQTSDRIKQDHNIMALFHNPLGLFNDHISHLHVTAGRLIESTRYHFATNTAFHFGYFFRTLIDQQHNEITFRMVCSNRLRYVIH